MELTQSEQDHIIKVLKNDRQFSGVVLSNALTFLVGITFIVIELVSSGDGFFYMLPFFGGMAILLALFNLRDAINDRKTTRILEKLAPEVVEKIDLRRR